MIRLIALSMIAFTLVGCGLRTGGTGSPGDADDVYEAALAHEIGGGTGEKTYVMVAGADPSPGMLERIQKRWPNAQASSAKPKEHEKWEPGQERSRHISVGELKWIDRDTAEVQGGFSNGMDGHHSTHRLVRKAGVWIVEKSTTGAIS